MFSRNGTGEMIPPYVVYKSKHLRSTWTEGGPPGCRCNRTKSGWVRYGDIRRLVPLNPASSIEKAARSQGCDRKQFIRSYKHRSSKVLWGKQYKVCLPTSKLHSPHPAIGRNLLRSDEKKSGVGYWLCGKKKNGQLQIPKDPFPALLKTLIDHLYVDKKKNIISGF